ncbi:MAG TPA: zinc-binding dehydrogenase [Pusillimonas sp.]|uniref:zinc-binding dehydrogenase n=1 Tax=Pusillimonas sp. TaxID=3040095 RepID=UPI002C80D4B8|nr:zinc-binding dehydrogenase [Pusillimonas sp.]HUH88259.1 zinc-binding dehydrogenase [Pusillimonas sp.]
MKAALIRRHGAPEVLQLENIPVPKPGKGELLVRMLSTSVNHRDVWIRKGHPHPAYYVDLPTVLGVDVCGVIEEAGEGVDAVFKPGTRIIANPYLACGKCHRCRQGEFQYCASFTVYNGSYAEYAVVSAANAVCLSDDVPVSYAAAFPNSYITAWQMLVGKAGVSPADTVFVWAGTSGLGSAAIEIAKLAGAKVITSAGTEEKLKMLQGYEPDLIVNHYQPDMVDRVMDFTDGRGASIVFEHVGKSSWQRTLELCAHGGTIVTAGATSGDEVAMDITYAFVKQVRILGSRLGTMKDLSDSVRHLNSGYFKPLIGKTLPLEDIAHAHELMEAGQIVGKITLEY